VKIYNKLILIQRIIALLIILTLIVGVMVFYYLNNYPKVEVRYVDKIIKQKEVVTEYVEVDGYDWQEFICTGYSANDPQQGTNNIVATTFNLDYTRVKNLPIVATDPDVIPLYSIVEIKDLGAFISLDTGGAIKGNRIDILFNTKKEALLFGKQQMEVRVID